MSERKRERLEKRQTLSREQHDVRRGCRQRATTTGERNDDGYTRAAPPTPTLNDVIPPAATWSLPTYARTTRDTNTTTRTTHDNYDDSRSLATTSRRAVPVRRLTSKNVSARVTARECERERTVLIAAADAPRAQRQRDTNPN